MTSPHSLSHRPDVDALRAIAVLAVFLFHLDFVFIPGGFVGVDVFYVISGYVIFRAVLNEAEAGHFSLAKFWRRRVCRILPALLLTVAFCFPLGWWLMTPAEYAEFGSSALSALFSVSNFYFNDRLQYFGDNAREVPLVHTWSLGVEEQFYLTAPLLVLALLRVGAIGRLGLALALVAAVSFAYNIFAVYGLQDEKHAFYLPMARFWEIAIGGLVAIWERRRTGPLPFSALLAWIGLAGIAAACLLVDTNTPFPGVAALLPVAATALFLATGLPETALGGTIMSATPLTFVGRISYSTYLFHWPAITFASIASGGHLGLTAKLLILGLTLVAAWASFHLVETPFRQAYRNPTRGRGLLSRPITLIAVAGVALATLAAILPLTEGLPARMSPEAARLLAAEQAKPEEQSPCARLTLPSAPPKAGLCSSDPTLERFDYVLWGDSHAGMHRNALAGEAAKSGLVGMLATLPDCPPLLGVYTSKRKNRDECMALQAFVLNQFSSKNADTIILGGRWANLGSPERAPGDGSIPKTLYDTESNGAVISLVDALTRTVDRFYTAGARIIVIGPTPEVDYSVPAMMVRAAHLGQSLPPISRAGFDRRQAEVFAALAHVESTGKAIVVYPHEQLCDAKACRVTSGAKPLYSDDDHLSPAGAALVAPAIAAALSPKRAKSGGQK